MLMKKCKKCWKENPAEVHTCTPMWEYKVYKKWDKLPWIIPMIAWEEISRYEEKWIFIQCIHSTIQETLDSSYILSKL